MSIFVSRFACPDPETENEPFTSVKEIIASQELNEQDHIEINGEMLDHGTKIAIVALILFLPSMFVIDSGLVAQADKGVWLSIAGALSVIIAVGGVYWFSGRSSSDQD